MAHAHLTVVVGEPLWVASATGSGQLFAIDVETYRHQIIADGGYDSCDFGFGSSVAQAEEWLFESIGRDISVYDDTNVLIWRGFVNTIEANVGALSVKRGPLVDIGNKVAVKYQTPSYTIDAVTIGGDQSLAAFSSDAASIAKYGTREKIISAGTANSTEATQIQQTYLTENKDPRLTHDLAPGDVSGAMSVNVGCLGYYHLLDYHPESTGSNNTMNLSDKITTIMGLDPDNIFSTNYGKVWSNTTQVAQYWESDQTALEHIKGLVALGGPSPSYSRYIWGIYGDLQLSYNAIPSEYEYEFNVTNARQSVYTSDGVQVHPWNILPGKFAFLVNFMTGRPLNKADFTIDPRIMFIQSVSYTAPWGLQITGGRVTTLDQKLNRLNLGPL